MTVTVDLMLGVPENQTREIPIIVLPADTPEADRREVDRWRKCAFALDGYTAIGRS